MLSKNTLSHKISDVEIIEYVISFKKKFVVNALQIKCFIIYINLLEPYSEYNFNIICKISSNQINVKQISA